jgi:hypothetical protein
MRRILTAYGLVPVFAVMLPAALSGEPSLRDTVAWLASHAPNTTTWASRSSGGFDVDLNVTQGTVSLKCNGCSCEQRDVDRRTFHIRSSAGKETSTSIEFTEEMKFSLADLTPAATISEFVPRPEEDSNGPGFKTTVSSEPTRKYLLTIATAPGKSTVIRRTHRGSGLVNIPKGRDQSSGTSVVYFAPDNEHAQGLKKAFERAIRLCGGKAEVF